MATIRQLRRRIQSVRNTARITHALELVAASKMRRAQERALEGRPYAEKLEAVLAGLAGVLARTQSLESLHPLLQRREEVRTVGVLHITPDRGLCGGLNANLNRSAGMFVASLPQPAAIVAVGKKGRDFFIRARQNVVAEFTELGDYPSQLDTLPIARLIIEDYLAGVVDRVSISYARFINTVTQRPVVQQLLPIEPPEALGEEAAEQFRVDYIFEPSPRAVFERLLPRYVEMLIYHAVLESAASEQSARMVAMKNATDNANELVRELTLTYNKARQEQITKELLDIVGGAAAIQK